MPAACVTVNTCPAIVRVPLRAAPVLAATLKTTAPGPTLLPPAVIVIHDVAVVAVHAQPMPAVTVTVLAVAPVAAAVRPVGLIEYVHGAGPETAACVTVRSAPPIVNRPVRAAPVFAATVNPRLCVPTPAPTAAVNQAASLETAHTQPGWLVCTEVEPGPPAAAAACVVGDKL